MKPHCQSRNLNPYNNIISTAMERNTGKRIVKNTVMMYVRMIGVMLINLYASRLVLQILGVSDYGIYNVVGGFVTMFAFLDVSISNAAQRYISIGLGSGNKELTKHYFEQSFTILLLIAILTAVVCELVGTWYIGNKLVVPSDRLNAAFWVFHFSVVSVICTIIRVVFLANIIAREELNAFAYISILEAISRWLILYILLVIGGDNLIWYAFWVMIISISCLALYAIYCKLRYPECSFRIVFDRVLIKELSSFIGLTTFGGFSHTVSNQGINLILNFFFGPIVNAARGISVQVSSLIGKLNTSISVPVRPVIVKAYANNNIDDIEKLIYKSSKFTFCLIAIVSFTLIVEMEYVLQIWLGQVPPYTVNFCRLAICNEMVLALVAPLSSTANATGKILKFELYGRMITLSSLPLSYACLLYSKNPYIPVIMIVICNLLYWTYCLFDIVNQLELSIMSYYRSVIIPCLALLLMIGGISYGLISILPLNHLASSSIILVANTLVGLLVLYIFSSHQERDYYRNVLAGIYRKVKKQ